MYYTTDELIEASQETSKPVIALVAYKNNDSEYYIESHKIDDCGRLREGTPLTKECITDLVSGFSIEYSDMPYGKTPPNLLYADNRSGHNVYVWYNPARQRTMYFSQNLNLENDLYHVPGVLYAVKDNHLDIYAFKGKRPTDKLYKAPFFNVTDASVCLGNATLEYPKEPSFSEVLEYWEKKFWMSEFTYLGGGQNPTKSNLYLAVRKWKDRFDYTELLASETTLNDLLS